MSSRVLRGGLVFALVAAIPGRPVVAQNAWVQDWLTAYADGHQAEIAAKLRTVGSLKALQDDLERLQPKWLEPKGETGDKRRQALVAFSLEAAAAKITQGPAVGKLVEFACRQIRRHAAPDEFDHRAQMLGFALLAGAVDADALEAHVTHVKFQFPNEPRLAIERAIAEELRTAPFYEPDKQSADDIQKHREEAVKRFTAAAKVEAIKDEARLRLGHVSLELGKPEEALAALDQVSTASGDPSRTYLTHLFRGLALDRLGRTDEAAQAYRAALSVRPAESASLALAALTFRRGDRGAADTMVHELLTRQARPDDPWLEYWPGDYPRSVALISAMREAMK